MINFTYINIAAISTVPCTVVGASGYVGYQYYTTHKTSVNDADISDNDFSDYLAGKKLQLKHFEDVLKVQESLLQDEQTEQAKLKVELTHYEIASINLIKVDIEDKHTTFVADELAKTNHETSLASLKKEKDTATSDKKTKQDAVDNKNQLITSAKELYEAQVIKEQQDLQKQTESGKAATKADEAHKAQLIEEGKVKVAQTKNNTDIVTHTNTLTTKNTERTGLDSAKTQAESVAAIGKTTCDTTMGPWFQEKAAMIKILCLKM